MKRKLDEDLFDDIEIQVPIAEPDPTITIDSDMVEGGPADGPDTGLAELIIDNINDEWEAIRGYNTLKANVGSHTEFIPIIEDIAAEENNHVGMLQKMLEQISPNVQNIGGGEVEAADELEEEDFPGEIL